MTTYATGNPIGSTAVKDLFDNAENLDYWANGLALQYPDRFGVARKSYRGIEQDASDALEQVGYVYTNPLNYAAGITITLPNQIFNKDGEYYKPAPGLSFPYVTTGVWATEQANFRSVGDATLRTALAQPNGVSLVGGSLQNAASIAALRALPTGGASKYAQTAGYYVPGDGGHGTYYASSLGGQVEDGCTVIAATDGGFWLLQHYGTINILQAGAKTGKVWDCTSAINAAIAAAGNYAAAGRGGKVLIPNDWFNFTGTLVIDKPFVTIEGTSLQGPLLRALTNSVPAIRAVGNFTAIKNVEINYAITPVAGAAGIEIIGTNFNAHHVVVSNAWDGYWFRAGNAHVLDNVRAYDCINTGWRFEADSGFMNDVILTNWFAVTNDQSRFALGQFRVVKRLEALMLGAGDGIGGTYSFTSDPVGTDGLRYSTFNSCYWDSTSQGAIFTGAHYNKFVNCWASGGRGSNMAGLSFVDCTHFSLSNSMCFNSGAAGLQCLTSSDFTITTCDFSSNSLDVDGSSAGVLINNCLRFSLANNTGHGTRQVYGILVDNSSDFNVVGNAMGASKNGPVIIGTACSKFSAPANVGYTVRKADSATLPASATSVVVSHGLSRPPLISGIRLQANGATLAPLYVSAVSASQFTVSTQTANAGGTPFSWEASAETVN